MTQYGFFFDQSRCIGCNACVVACKQWHHVPPGPAKWIRVYQWERGGWSGLNLHLLVVPCYHCEHPVCMKACPNDALYKEEKYGALLVREDRCKGDRKCWQACPYGAPQFEGDGQGAIMSKCTMCYDRLENHLKPICVLSCSMRALEFGPIEELREKYGNVKRLQDMPGDSMMRPAVVFKPRESKRQVLSWDSNRTLELWQRRESNSGEQLPNVFPSASDLVPYPHERVGRNKLVLKSRNNEEKLYHTMDDE